MPCVNPLHGWLGRSLTKSGKRPIVFRRAEALLEEPRLVPCKRCVSCRASRASQWATRSYLELLDTPPFQSCFVTFTYDDAHLPLIDPGSPAGAGHSLRPRDLTLFWKLLRRRGFKVRYLACGEYGDVSNRPHYHAIIFGFCPDDQVVFSSTVNTSAFLSSLWPHGLVTVGEACASSAAYVAGYIAKKLSRESYPCGVVPPFIRASSVPPLGIRWLYRNVVGDKLYTGEGHTAPIPSALLKLLEVPYNDIFWDIKARRASAARVSADAALHGPSVNSIEATLLAGLKSRETIL